MIMQTIERALYKHVASAQARLHRSQKSAESSSISPCRHEEGHRAVIDRATGPFDLSQYEW